MRFSGLRSLWDTPFEWQWLIARNSFFIITAAFYSVKDPPFLALVILSNRSYPLQYSMIMYTCLGDSYVS